MFNFCLQFLCCFHAQNYFDVRRRRLVLASNANSSDGGIHLAFLTRGVIPSSERIHFRIDSHPKRSIFKLAYTNLG